MSFLSIPSAFPSLLLSIPIHSRDHPRNSTLIFSLSLPRPTDNLTLVDIMYSSARYLACRGNDGTPDGAL